MDPKKRILIVDDEPNVRLMLETTLASVGYEVTEADGRASALEHLSDPSPGRPGLARPADAQARRHGAAPRLASVGNIVPVVILTAHGSIPEAVEA